MSQSRLTKLANAAQPSPEALAMQEWREDTSVYLDLNSPALGRTAPRDTHGIESSKARAAATDES